MTFTQLEYVVAVDTTRHFAKAAELCFVTQPTLSMQLQKLESELGIRIFDRSRQPVGVTEAGYEIVTQARKVLAERDALLEAARVQKGIMQGRLSLGIIPTLAPYLLPLFVPLFAKKYPEVKLVVHELTTEGIVQRLREGRLDAGLLVTPLQEASIEEDPLFYEELVAYVSARHRAYAKQYVLPSDLDPARLWLLEEGHCFRSQIVNLCELREKSRASATFEYEAGSLETLRRLVELNDGLTVLPELATLELSGRQQKHLRHFKAPAPVREVSLVTYRGNAKQRLLRALRESLLATLPDKLRQNKSKRVVPLAI